MIYINKLVYHTFIICMLLILSTTIYNTFFMEKEKYSKDSFKFVMLHASMHFRLDENNQTFSKEIENYFTTSLNMIDNNISKKDKLLIKSSVEHSCKELKQLLSDKNNTIDFSTSRLDFLYELNSFCGEYYE